MSYTCPVCRTECDWDDYNDAYYCPTCNVYFDPADWEDDDCGERLSASDAEDIWRSSGMDEDYDFR